MYTIIYIHIYIYIYINNMRPGWKIQQSRCSPLHAITKQEVEVAITFRKTEECIFASNVNVVGNQITQSRCSPQPLRAFGVCTYSGSRDKAAIIITIMIIIVIITIITLLLIMIIVIGIIIIT